MQNISIPTGTIKSSNGISPTLPSRTFQFLLVRLKETSKTVICLVRLISIPTGTIKSSSRGRENLRDSISIPTGTIKSQTSIIGMLL